MQDTYQRHNIQKYFQDVEMPGGYSFNTAQTVKLIDLYYNSKYATGQYDSRGFRKLFYNIGVDKCNIARKFTDLDTKDILLIAEHPDDEHRTWLLQRELKQYLKETNFADLLNKIGFNYPKYGHVFLKKTGGKWRVANIHNFRFDPASESLETDSWFYEVHPVMSRSEIQSSTWDKKAVATLLDNQEETFVIYECYDLVDGKWYRQIKGEMFTTSRGGSINRSLEAKINDYSQDYIGSVILSEGPADPNDYYKELKWEEVPGRRLGFGFMESLFDNQMAENEAENLERKGLYYKALQLFQTRDQAVGRNVLTDAENGDILFVDSEITPIQKENSDLAAFNQTRARWTQNAEQKTFSFDISRGENLPSRTPLGVANLSAGMVASYFEYKRENFGNFIRYLLLNDIIPDLSKKSNQEHILTVVGTDNDIDKFDKAVADQLVSDATWNYVMKNGILPDATERQAERQRVVDEIKKKKNRYVLVPKNFYTNAIYNVDVVTTGEQIDTGAKMQTLQVAMQVLASNPAIVQNPGTRSIFFKMLEYGGVSPVDLNLMEEQAQQAPPMQMPQGGSTAAPGAPGPAISTRYVNTVQ